MVVPMQVKIPLTLFVLTSILVHLVTEPWNPRQNYYMAYSA